MVTRNIASLLCCAAMACAAQETPPSVGKGLLRSSAAISPGFLLNGSGTNIYLNGRSEYFMEDRISFRGEGFWFRGSQEDPGLLAQNSQLAFGPFVHFVRGRSDLAMGIEPGLSIVQPARVVAQDAVEPLRIVPNASLCASYTFFVWDHFHFFLDARYVHASYPGALGGAIPLDELIVGGGLGWQFTLKKS